jgi:hypothetical protein
LRVLCIHRIQVFDYLNKSLLSPLKKSNQSPFRMAGLCGKSVDFLRVRRRSLDRNESSG